ncbi:M23 family metallopeptidase [Reichenbachiella sp. MALMAid0571]|uniref:M23 family metallopeptidase n=1 Tax=Reichenbachiella sp. MALMAid0571 TaxID=3143939 RepID=UPI0032DEDA34
MCPVRPGEVNYLAGTMGELRSTHFHTGIDIKTSGVSGLPVFAAADGYIQRIKVSPSGYGNALYMVHPNGTYTVYAHLQEFQDAVANYVRDYQYKRESFAVDISVPKDRFTFKKGDVIALSGNSGSSSGPHLHFEIRDANQEVLNPLTYGFSEIKDLLPPTLSHIAFVTMDIDSRVNGMFGRFEYAVIEQDGGYVLEVPVTLTGKIGVEVYVYDQLNGVNNRNGVVRQTLLFDFKPVFNQEIDRINFGTSRNILVHTNYKRMVEGGRRFNKLYVDDGNFLKFYNIDDNKGVLHFSDPLEHAIDVKLEDNYGNVRQYHIMVNDKGYLKNASYKNMYRLNRDGFDMRNEILEVMSKGIKEDCFARFYIKGEEKLLAHTYSADGRYFYLWDVRNGHPDSAVVCDQKFSFNYKNSIPSNVDDAYADKNVEITFPRYSLFDTLHLSYAKTIDSVKQSEYFSFAHYDQPLRKYVTMKITPELKYDRQHSFVYSVGDNKVLYFVGGEWSIDGNITFKTRDLVNYTIATDIVPPTISHFKSKPNRLKFRIEDEMSGVGTFTATLNGKWLLMNYDAKTGYLYSDPKTDIVGEFVLTVNDNSGNKKEWRRSF